jgi:predicted Fe-Mo cluster-binding NifX family protein
MDPLFPNPVPEGDPDAIVRVAVSCFGEEVAPRFDTARRFRFWKIVRRVAREYRELTVEEPGGIARVRLLRRVQADVLICNGIEESFRRILETEGCVVIDGVLGSATDALFGYLAGQILPRKREDVLDPDRMQNHTADLVEWTKELFSSLGWEVKTVLQSHWYPVDLWAERVCPICGRLVRVAVCCGAHAYRVDEEIRELKRAIASGCDAGVYVHHAIPGVFEICRECNIELLDPDDFSGSRDEERSSGLMPPLRGPVNGHERFNQKQYGKS